MGGGTGTVGVMVVRYPTSPPANHSRRRSPERRGPASGGDGGGGRRDDEVAGEHGAGTVLENAGCTVVAEIVDGMRRTVGRSESIGMSVSWLRRPMAANSDRRRATPRRRWSTRDGILSTEPGWCRRRSIG